MILVFDYLHNEQMIKYSNINYNIRVFKQIENSSNHYSLHLLIFHNKDYFVNITSMPATSLQVRRSPARVSLRTDRQSDR